MATNSSRKRRSWEAKDIREHFGLSDWQPSLPYCVLDERGNLLGCNSRMLDLLGIKETPTLPLARKLLTERWPFFNEHSSSMALLAKVSGGAKDALDAAIPAEAGLKTFRLKVHCASKARLVTAELVRRGDLLQDKNSRQALFRSLSHEIRTAVLSLKGYRGMLEEGASPKAEILERMDHALKRLDQVVKRLEEFKAELGVEA